MKAKTIFKNYHEALAYFEQLYNEKKAAFAKKIINSPKLKFYGIDAKTMEKIIKNYSLTEGPLDYAYELTSLIFASKLALIEDDNALIDYVLEFIPNVDNWAHIDAIFTYNKVKRLPFELLFPKIRHTRNSEHEFVSRFYYVAFIMYKQRTELYADFLKTITESEKHYTFMAIAWVISELFPQSDVQILDYLRTAPLSKKTKLKAIQKIKESRKTTPAQRELLEELRVIVK
ncbi:MAG: DNA alkylation repair protein [Bacteroidales bacterium]|jgi:hypothetical protein|nr:DNA alkylation repair protein [Bacteroidales bacterium]